MKLRNETLLRSFLAHLQSEARQLAALYLERMSTTSKPFPESQLPAIAQEWEKIRTQITDILGVEAQLKPWGELAQPGGFSACEQLGGRDPFRITMGVFKDKCDKARRSKPHLTLMKSWDKAAKAMTFEDHQEICEQCSQHLNECALGRRLINKEKAKACT